MKNNLKSRGQQIQADMLKVQAEKIKELEAKLSETVKEQPKAYQKVPTELLQATVDILTNSPTGTFSWVQINNVVQALLQTERFDEHGEKIEPDKVPEKADGEAEEPKSLEVREVEGDDAKLEQTKDTDPLEAVA